MRLIRGLAAAAALALIPLARWAPPAAAAPYEAFIDVESQEDLDDLLATGDISTETYEALTEVLARGVDLDRASRDDIYSLPNLTYAEVDAILDYRATQRFIADPIDLVGAGALSEQKLLAISAFLVVRDRARGEFAPRGWVRAQIRASNGDDQVPPTAIRARATFGRNIIAGAVAALSRTGVTNAAWDDNRDGVLIDLAGVRPHLPKAFVRYRGDKIDVIAGTYRVGFGQRLTFDNSADYTPSGIYYDDQIHYGADLTKRCRESSGELPQSPCTGDAGLEYQSRDFSWSDGLLGIAAGSDHIPLGAGHVVAYGWGSYQPRNLYQYQLLDRSACVDPYDTADPSCDAPPVYVRPSGDVLTPATAASYQTLPNAYAEALVGGHVAIHAARRDYVGVTAYGATTRWLIGVPDDVRLDFQDWARTPIGGTFGAVGVSAGIGRGIYEGNLEVTRSFDRAPAGPGAVDGGGGVGAIARFTRSLRKRELELSLRYYDVNFDNPYAGPISAADQVDGARARGEHGARIRYNGTHGVATVRAAIDLWRGYVVELDEYLPRLSSYARVDVQGSDQVGYGLWLDYADKDLRGGGYGQCYDTVTEPDEIGRPVPCQGMRLKTTGRLRYTPAKDLNVIAQVQHAWQDDTHYTDRRRSDLGGSVAVTWRQSKDLRVRGRVRYIYEDISDNTILEQSLWTYGELVQRVRGKDTLTVRADLFVWLDDRSSTAARTPSPELRALVGYTAKF